MTVAYMFRVRLFLTNNSWSSAVDPATVKVTPLEKLEVLSRYGGRNGRRPSKYMLVERWSWGSL